MKKTAQWGPSWFALYTKYCLGDEIKECQMVPACRTHDTRNSGYGLKNPGFESSQRQEIYRFCETSRSAVDTSTSYSIGTVALSRGWDGRGARLTTHLHLVPKLRMSEAIPPFPIHVFMVCVGTILHKRERNKTQDKTIWFNPIQVIKALALTTQSHLRNLHEYLDIIIIIIMYHIFTTYHTL
jgi:hypothetical protein